MPSRRSPSRRLRNLQLQLSPAAVETTFEKKQAYIQAAPDAAFYHEYPSSSTMYDAEETEAAVPRPAMTPGERLHLEINGVSRHSRRAAALHPPLSPRRAVLCTLQLTPALSAPLSTWSSKMSSARRSARR